MFKLFAVDTQCEENEPQNYGKEWHAKRVLASARMYGLREYIIWLRQKMMSILWPYSIRPNKYSLEMVWQRLEWHTMWPSQYNICIQHFSGFFLWQASVSHPTSKWNAITMKKLFHLFSVLVCFFSSHRWQIQFSLLNDAAEMFIVYHILWTFTLLRFKQYDNQATISDDNSIEYDKSKRSAFVCFHFESVQFAFKLFKAGHVWLECVWINSVHKSMGFMWPLTEI